MVFKVQRFNTNTSYPMLISTIIDKLGLEVFAGATNLNREVEGGYTSDLLSDVMGNADAGYVWITLQTHKNVMAIASLKELSAVILVKGNEPDADTIELSNQEEVPLLGTKLEAFEISGKLYQLLNC